MPCCYLLQSISRISLCWCLQVQCVAESAGARAHWAGLAPSHQAWQGIGSSESTPVFTWISASCACLLGLYQEGKHMSVAVDCVLVCCCQWCAWWRPRYRDQGCLARHWRWARGRSDLPLQLSQHQGLQFACGCFCSCRNWGAASAGLVAAFHLPQPAVGAGSVLPPSLLLCPWYTSSMQEVHALSLATLLCKQPRLP